MTHIVSLHWLTSVSLSFSLCGLTVISSNVFGLAQNSLLTGSTFLLVQLARLMRPMGFWQDSTMKTSHNYPFLYLVVSYDYFGLLKAEPLTLSWHIQRGETIEYSKVIPTQEQKPTVQLSSWFCYLALLIIWVGPVGDAVSWQDTPPPVPGSESTDIFKHCLWHKIRNVFVLGKNCLTYMH